MEDLPQLGRLVSATTGEHQVQLMTFVLKSPQKSSTSLSRELGVRRMLRQENHQSFHTRLSTLAASEPPVLDLDLTTTASVYYISVVIFQRFQWTRTSNYLLFLSFWSLKKDQSTFCSLILLSKVCNAIGLIWIGLRKKKFCIS